MIPSITMRRLLTAVLLLHGAGIALGQSSETSATAPTEDDFYRIVDVPVPRGIELEIGGMALRPDGALAVATRRGEVWIVHNPYADEGSRPYFRRFAYGLHEPLGLAYRDGALYTNQRGELTRLVDLDGDDLADRYEAIVSWPLEGNYHEYSYGPVFKRDGSMLVTLNLAWIGHGASLSKWRGWLLEVSPEGEVTPLATGLRSPAGFGLGPDEAVFYAENQGDWIGSGRVTHLERGDFAGNPAGLRWTNEPGAPLTLRPEDVPDTGEPMHVVAERLPELKLPAVWFPHALMGISTSGILIDSTDGAFGPFAGQYFVGDQGHSKVMRMYLEEVDGVWQGAAFPFREGFASGILRLAWGADRGLFVGMTSRGWAAAGEAPFGLQRLLWTGRTPFEIQTIEARPDGFELTFTKEIDRTVASDTGIYEITGFTYHYHSTYGSDVIERDRAPVRAAIVSEDARRVRLVAENLRRGYIHELRIPHLRAASGEPLLHEVAYYTLNRIPQGDGIDLASPDTTTSVGFAPSHESSAGASPTDIRSEEPTLKRQTERPAAWSGVDATVSIGTLPGLRFDRTEFLVRAGDRVQIVFNNDDDMLHNLVVTRPGTADAVAEAALHLGLDGPQMFYVPDSPDVLFHTALLQPEASERIYFRAPSEPGVYPFVCTFPGHAFTMRGEMRVVAD